MRSLAFASRKFDSDLAAFCRAAKPPVEVTRSVSRILADVRARGDAALAYYARRFDGAKLAASQFRVTPSEISSAARRLSAASRQALMLARSSIEDFNGRSVPKDWSTRNPHGALVGEKFDPIRRVGIYVPGGQVPLVSTVLMTATLARIAGCPQIAAFTPCGADGRIAPDLLGALHFVGVREVYRLGGAQAIGAMAFGTATIAAVDKIFGPGNAYVCEAKRQVFGTVGVDLLPGPSELMVVADGSARLDLAAADLLAQAEHGSGREKLYLVATSPRIVAGVRREVESQLKGLKRSEKIQRVFDEGFLAVEVANLRQAAEVANAVAPEHLELLVREGEVARLVKAVTTAGAIMVGAFTPTALGDFVAGPSHVLPTGGAGRFSSGLRVLDFMRRTSVARYDKRSLRRAASAVAAFSAMERLDAHGWSVSMRVSEPGPQ